MKILYLHIGTMKTGTTAIQTFMENNTDFLEKNNCVYPMFPYYFQYSAHRRNGKFIDATYTDENGDSSNERNQEMVTDCLNTIVELFKKYDKIVVSDEVLFWNLGKTYKYRTKRLLKCAEDNDFQIKIIVYLRKQSEIVEAQWNQSIKQNSGCDTFEEFKKKMIEKQRYDYAGRLDSISKVFGKENIIVRRFQKGDLEGGSSVTDFLQSIEIEVPENLDTSKEETKRNARLSNNMIYIKRYINLFTDASREGTDISRKAFEKATDSKSLHEYNSSPMSKEETIEFMKRYKDGNDEVAEKYIGDGRPLFNDEYKDLPKWEFENTALLEDVIKSNGAMFGEILAVMEEQNKKIKELEEKVRIKNIVKRFFKLK